MRKKIKKSFKIVMLLMMIFSLSISSIQNIFAINADNKNDYPSSGSSHYNGKVSYGGTTVGDFTINGMQAFCMEHLKPTPPTGTQFTAELYDNNDIKKVLYYGWNGPEQWSGFKSREHGIVVTSLVLSYYYSGSNTNPSLIKPYLDYLSTKTMKKYSVNFSKSNVKAYKEGNIQRTETVTLNSEMDIFGVDITIPNEVTYVDETHGISQTGGSLTIKGQTSFHFEAPLNVKIDIWSTGAKTSYYDYMPIVYVTEGNYQNPGNLKPIYDPMETTSLQVEWLQLGSLEITKNDIYGNLVNGAVFKLWNNNGYSENITVTNGKLKIDNLLADVYYLQEQSAPSGFLIDNNVYTVTLNVGDDIKQTVTNKEPKGKITVVKTNDRNDRVNGAVIDILADGDIRSAKGNLLYASGTVVDTVTTSSNGSATTKELPLGKYKGKERTAPHGYLLNKNEYKVSLIYANQNTSLVMNSITIDNKEPLGTIDFQKEVDSNVTNNLLGDVFLSQLKYGLYAKNDIYNVMKTKKHYSKDQLISSKITDSKGHIKWDNLPMGNYYLKELETNNSLLINNNIIDVSITYKDMNTSVVSKSTSQKNKVASQRIQIFKEGIKDGVAGVVQGLQGAEFTFVLNKDYKNVGFENAKKYHVGTTDKNGFLTTGILPYGEYRVRETKTPEGYYGASDFLVKIEKDSSLHEIGYEIKKVTVNNVPFETLLKIQKIDEETGKSVLRENAKYKIKDLDKDEYVSYTDWSQFPNIIVDSWSTHADGTITLNKTLKTGHYQLEEIGSPDNYIINKTPLKFEIKKDDNYDIAEDGVTPIMTIKFTNNPTKGEIKIIKEGDVLTKYDEETKQFVYERRGLKDTIVEVYAKEDILDPSNNGDVLFKKGDLVDTITTNEKGEGKSKKIPLGRYEIEEIKAPQYFVVDNQRREVTLEYENENVELVSQTHYFYNERQKVKVETSKQDTETLEYVEGAEITLKANRDVYNYDGDKIVNEGTILETVKTDEKGKATFKTDLPNDMCPEYATMPIDEFDNVDEDFSNTVIDGVKLIGNPNSLFVVYESKEPSGYIPFKLNYYIDTKYTSQIEKELKFQTPFMNDITITELLKTESTGEKLISGNLVCVVDYKTKQIVDEWTTTDKPHILKGLTLDRKYIYRELKPIDGYTKAEDIVFIAKEYQEIVMKNNPLVYIHKLDSETEKFIENTHIQIINDETNEVVYDYMTSDKEKAIELLEGTKYRVHEVKEAEGYILTTEDITFVASPNLVVKMYNDMTVTELLKTESTGEKLISGNLVCVVDYKTKQIVDEWTTTDKPHILKGLTLDRKYIYRELKPIDGYTKAEDIVFIAKEHQEIVMKNNPLVYIHKLDSETEKFIENTHIQIINDETNEVVYDYMTSDKEKAIELLEGTQYRVHEVKEAEGYVLTTEDITFVASPNLVVKLYNEPIAIETPKTEDMLSEEDLLKLMSLFSIASVSMIYFIYKNKKNKEHIDNED